MIPLNYHHLYYFYTIARAGSIAKACDELLLGQPTLSMQLKQLEKSLGHKLFERRNQRLHLTEEGRVVLDYAESLFEIGRELKDAMRDRRGKGRLAIQVGILSGSPRSYGQSLIEAVLKKDPDAHVSVTEGRLSELLGAMRNHELDIVLTDVNIRSQDQEEFISHPVGRVPIVLAAARRLARRYGGPVSRLDGAPFILVSSPSQIYYQVQDLFAQWKIKPRVVAEVQDAELGRRLALAGRGVVPLNAYTVALSLPANALVPLSLDRPLSLHESVYLVTRKRRWMNPLADHLQKSFRLQVR